MEKIYKIQLSEASTHAGQLASVTFGGEGCLGRQGGGEGEQGLTINHTILQYGHTIQTPAKDTHVLLLMINL